MVVLMASYQVVPSVNLVVLPFFVAGTTLAALGVGTLCAGLVVAYRDFRYVIPFVVSPGMFASPVAYPLEVVPADWQLLYAPLTPWWA